MKIGIKFQLIAFTGCLLFAVIAFLSTSVLNGVKTYQESQIVDTLFAQKDLFELYFSDVYRQDGDSDKEILDFTGSVFDKTWLRNIPASLYDTKGEMLSGFSDDSSTDKNDEKANMIQSALAGQVVYREYDSVVYFYSPIKYKENTIAILELKYSVTEKNKFYVNIQNMFFTIGSAALLFGIIFGILYFSKITRDIYTMRNSVENIQKGDFKKVKIISRKDELGELSSGLIAMSNTIEKNIKDLQGERDSLSLAVSKLEIMGKQQKEFIGNVTHEFKTPITTIKAYGDLIGMYPEDLNLITEGTTKISKECDRLTSLVERVLNLSVLEKYDFEIQTIDVNLKEALNDICDRLSGKARRNNLEMTWSLSEVVINIDEESLRHICVNLIDNSIKYNKENGSINVECYREGDFGVIIVEDTGIGIDEVNVKKVFDAFYRVDKHRSRDRGGAGLGLALVKKLVERQNGEITVTSEINVGSKFVIKFPVVEN